MEGLPSHHVQASTRSQFSPPHPPTHDERRRLAGIGFGIGLAMSWCTFHFLHWLRWRGAKPYVENSVIIAVAYLSFYVANDPAKATAACWWF